MAFNFLKKGSEKEESEDNLEVPAPPPPPSDMQEEIPKVENEPEDTVAPPDLNEAPFLPDKEGEIDFASIQKDVEIPEEPEPEPTPKPASREKEVKEVKKGLGYAAREEGIIYLNMDEYKQLLNRMDETNERLKSLISTTLSIDKIEEREKDVFTSWHNSFEDLRKKMIFIDEVLFER